MKRVLSLLLACAAMMYLIPVEKALGEGVVEPSFLSNVILGTAVLVVVGFIAVAIGVIVTTIRNLLTK